MAQDELASLAPVPASFVVYEIKSALNFLHDQQSGPGRRDYRNEAEVEYTVLRLVFENHVDVWRSFDEIRSALEALYEQERASNQGRLRSCWIVKSEAKIE